jgi:hypothetical protein
MGMNSWDAACASPWSGLSVDGLAGGGPVAVRPVAIVTADPPAGMGAPE